MKKYGGILLGGMLLLFLHRGVQSCGFISLESRTIHLGSSLSASCTVDEKCLESVEGAANVLWKLDGDFIPFSSSQYSVHGNTSTVYFSSFNKTSGFLSCYNGKQLLDRVQIKAGYPPSKPTNLTCQLIVTDDSLICTWDSGKDPLIKTSVTLSSSKSTEQCESSAEKKHDCIPLEGQTSCTINRKHFHLYKNLLVWVTVENALGFSTSPLICITPMNVVKLDPPAIMEAVSVHAHPGCVSIRWRKSENGRYVEQLYQVRYRREDETQWTGPIEVECCSEELMRCGLSNAAKYHFQIRCIRSLRRGYWSDWGPARSVVTAELAPTGKLETWWRPTDEHPVEIQLFWKSLRKEEANADHLWYVVQISSGHTGDGSVVCNTTALSCSFPLPHGATRVSVWAYNSAGNSPGKAVTFSARNGTPVSRFQVYPNNDYSLRVEWEPQDSAKGFVLEWCKHAEHPHCEISWKKEPEGSHMSILEDNIEPFQMYTVWLYPLYEDKVGSPVQADAYSRQGVPEYSPKLTLTSVTKSEAELSWEPIPLERRHGFITNFTIYWTDESGKEFFAVLNNSSTNFVIKNLQPARKYKVCLSSATAGGSVNGSVLMIHTTHLDGVDIHMFIIVPFLFCVLVFIFILMRCCLKHDRFKNRFWPVIPDPVNSKMAKWQTGLQENLKLASSTRDVNQIISDLTILEGWTEKKRPDTYPTKYTAVFQQDFCHANNVQPQPFTQDLSTPRSYINVADTVQYAKVITGGCHEHRPKLSEYVRSNSTQPLLGDVSPSPQNYENMWFHRNNQEDSVFLEEEDSLANFPFLHALKIHEQGEAI